MAPHHTPDLCPRCPSPPGQSLYTLQGQADARSCHLCGYTRPAPPAGAARVLVFGTRSELDADHYYGLRRVLQGLTVGAISGESVLEPVMRGWARSLRVNRGSSYLRPGDATHVVILYRAVVPEIWQAAIDAGDVPVRRLGATPMRAG
jgi:hypothetical protein